ncbi:MAG: prepilin-type N-terminal cleavage/methylation domain-containing protein [Rubrivivax sp.]
MSVYTVRTDARRGAAARGFTLIEVMIVVAIVAILAAVAMPAYTAYIQRSKVPAGLDALQSYFTRMEQRFQDTGSYKKTVSGADACAIDPPTLVANYTVTCELTAGGYKATATGSGALNGYTYTIDSAGTRTTAAHPKTAPTGNCWSIKGVSCDA